MSVVRAIGRSVVVATCIAVTVAGCSSSRGSSATTTTQPASPTPTASPQSSTTLASSSNAVAAGITVTGDLEGALVLGPAFASCTGPECSGSVVIGKEAATLTVSPTRTE